MRLIGLPSCLLKFTEQAGDFSDVLVRQFLALAAEALAHLLPEAGGVDQLHVAFARFWLAVGEYPDVGADAGVVEHVGGQADDGFDQIVLQHVAADFTFAAACATGEQRRAVQHDAETAATFGSRAHFADQMQQKQHRAIGHTRQTGAEATIETLLFVFLADFLFDLLPFHTKRRIGEHVVEFRVRVAVIGEGVAWDDVGDILPFDEHVGLADGVGLVVQLLPEHGEPRLRVMLFQILTCDGQHATRARGRVVNGAHHARLGQHIVVFDEQQVDHQADDFARGEVFPGGLVGDFGELADQLFEYQSHLTVADDFGVQVDLCELFGDLIQQT